MASERSLVGMIYVRTNCETTAYHCQSRFESEVERMVTVKENGQQFIC